MNHRKPESDDFEHASGRVARKRSKIHFPAVSLDRAIRAAASVRKSYGSRCGFDDLAAALNTPTASSGFRTVLSAARMFGLVRVSNDAVELTDRGVAILEPARQDAAKVEAFLSVPLFRALHDAYGDQALPPTDELEQKIRSLGVTPKSATRARQILLRSADFAGFFQGQGTVPPPPVVKRSSEAPHRPAVPGDRTDDRPVPATPASAPAPRQRPRLLGAIWEMLPLEGEEFPDEQRSEWSKMLDSALNLVYGPTRRGSDDSDH